MAGDHHFVPRLLAAPEAAHYLSISESLLRELQIPRRVLRRKRLYDRIALDAYASSLPIEGEEVEDTCAGKFGRAR